ncbi:MAG: hypothetical protein R2745_25770 [Vicinamibacterales bacterium]
MSAGFGLTPLIVAAAFVGMATGLAVPVFGTLVATPARLDEPATRQHQLLGATPGRQGSDALAGSVGVRTDAGAGLQTSEPTAAATDLPSPGGRH